jgi:membrane protein DedA with SNARE-associated domain
MNALLEFITRHGGPVIFAIVFANQLGVPMPTVPLLLALGALAGTGRVDPASGFAIAVAASLAADFIWFRLGRAKGQSVLGFMCKISLEPDSCVNQTRDVFARYGVKSLLVAKFIPGYNTVGPPLAGILGVRTTPFLLWSCAGAILWLGAFAGLGFAFSERIEPLINASSDVANALMWVLAALVVLYIAWKYLARRRVLRSIAMSQITVDELHTMMTNAVPVCVVDARSHSALEVLPIKIAGAIDITLEEIDARHAEVPRDRDVVVYCS